MIKLLIIAVILIAIIAAAVLMLRSRTPSGPQIGSFAEIKKQIIEESRANPAAPRPDPVRPPDLDMRLPLETMAEHDKIAPDAPEAYKVAGDAMMSIYEELVAIDKKTKAYHLIAQPRQVLYAVFWFEAEINNGGLSQYYLNSAGDQAAEAPQYLRDLGLHEAADILDKANAFFPNATPPSDRAARLDILEEVEEQAADTWNELDNRFYQSGIDCQAAMLTHIRARRADFYKLD